MYFLSVKIYFLYFTMPRLGSHHHELLYILLFDFYLSIFESVSLLIAQANLQLMVLQA
jgi:hypothetical protein